MAISDDNEDFEPIRGILVQIESFEIRGLFGYIDHYIPFPVVQDSNASPTILIIEGQNGTGKTTILKMIAGIVSGLDFDAFRAVPFEYGRLKLSTGDSIEIRYRNENSEFPLEVTFREIVVSLAFDKQNTKYSPEQTRQIENFRAAAMPLINRIDFDLLTIDRSINVDSKQGDMYVDPNTGAVRARSKSATQARRVRDFLREAQVNYRRFFQADQLELLPRILNRLQMGSEEIDAPTLLKRTNFIIEKNSDLARFGLHTENTDLLNLRSLIETPQYSNSKNSLLLLSNYVEMHETFSNSRELIAKRLHDFEEIMADFFVGKAIKISFKSGLEISNKFGNISERDLSSGEFHFLYMMVSALLCERHGTIIAIDEPELSLHVTWQRKLVSALSKCASGASPLFVFATHSTAISAAHRENVVRLSEV